MLVLTDKKKQLNIYKRISPLRDLYIFQESFILFLHTCMFPACCFRLRIFHNLQLDVAQSHMNGAPNETRTQQTYTREFNIYVSVSVSVICK